MDDGVREFVLDYLLSPLARQVLATTARGTTGLHLAPSDLSAMRIPLPDEALASTLADLSKAAAVLETWHADAVALLSGLFENPSASAARNNKSSSADDTPNAGRRWRAAR